MQPPPRDRHTIKANQEQGSAHVGNGYPYEKLPTPTSIRLLELEPIRDGLPRTAKIHVVDPNDKPEYTALSYVWGDHTATSTCTCDGNEVKITQNLASFLRRYEGDGEPPTMWYDHKEETKDPSESFGYKSKFSACVAECSRTRPPGWKAGWDEPYRLDDAVNVLRSWPRAPKLPRLIWIDSLCINQKDPSEISQQIPLMGEIYRNATYVNVWLGERDEDTTVAALRALTLLSGLSWPLGHVSLPLNYEAFGSSGPEARQTKGLYVWDSIRDVAFTKAEVVLSGTAELRERPPTAGRQPLLDNLQKEDLGHFLQILRNTWFKRAWTYQESKLASRKVFSLGAYYFLARHLQAALCCLDCQNVELSEALHRFREELRIEGILETARDMLNSEANPPCCGTPDWLKDFYDNGPNDPIYATNFRLNYNGPDLHKLLARRRGAQCAIEVDIVYSLLGLVDSTKRIKPDPNSSWQEVFIRTVAPLSLEWVLRAASDQDEVAGLPSWVPDWRVQGKADRIALNFIIDPTLSDAGTLMCNMALSPCNRQLHLKGYIEDVIDRVLGRPLMTADRDERLFETRRKVRGHGGPKILPGDQIAVIWGLNWPLVIRRKQGMPSGTYRFIGVCLVFSRNIAYYTAERDSTFSGLLHGSYWNRRMVAPEGREEVTIVIEQELQIPARRDQGIQHIQYKR